MTWKKRSKGSQASGGDAEYALLQDALRDWRSGRAFFRKGRYWLRPIIEVAGGKTVGHSRAKLAPWSKVALKVYGDTTGLSVASHKEYPDAHLSDFQRLHALDPVASGLLQVMPLSKL